MSESNKSRFFNPSILSKGLARARSKLSSIGAGQRTAPGELEDDGEAPCRTANGELEEELDATYNEEDRDSFAEDDFGEMDESSASGVDRSSRGKLSHMVSKVKDITTGSSAIERLDEGFTNLYGSMNELEMRCKVESNSVKRGDTHGVGRGEDDDMTPQQKAFLESITVTKKSPEEVIESLAKEYFEATFDPVPSVIQEVGAWPKEESESSDLFMKRIEGLDTDKDLLEAKLGDLIDSHHSEIMQCMQNVETINTDLHDASRQIGNSRGLVLRGADALSDGPIKVADLRQRIARLEDVSCIVKNLSHVQSIYDAMENGIVTGDLGMAAECAFSMLHSYKHDLYNRFNALARLPSKIQKSVFTIRRKADRALLRLSGRKFASKEYENIVRCYLALDWMEETQGVRLVDASDEATTSDTLLDKFPCMDGLADRVQNFQHEDVECCLRTGVVEFIYASRQHKTHMASTAGGIGASAGLLYASEGLGMEDAAELEDLSMAELYPKVIPELMIPCIVRSCELLVDVVHTHYLITQWHLAPFDPQNEDTKWLHRKPINPLDVVHDTPWDHGNDEDEFAEEGKTSDGASQPETGTASSVASEVAAAIGGTEDSLDAPSMGENGADSTKATTSPRSRRANGLGLSLRSPTRLRAEVRAEITESFRQHYDSPTIHKNGTESANERQLGLQSMKLSSCYQTLCSNRAALWDSLTEELEGALDLVVLSAAVSQSDFMHMSWAINAMVRLGREFCGNESTRLQNCLERKSREYYYQVHGESFHILKQMVDNDGWHNVPVSLQDLGGIMQVIASSTPALAATGAISREKQTCNMGLGGMVGLAYEAQLGVFDTSRRDIAASPAASAEGSKDASSSPSQAASGGASGSSILVFCGQHGNPLHFMTDIGADIDSEDDSDEYSEEEEAEGNDQNSPHIGNNEESDGKTEAGSESGDIFRRLLTSTEPSSGVSPQKQKRKAQAGAFVVTQAAFGGLTRCAGRYMQMMFLMPSTAPTVFQGLRQLFDLYACSVFTGFVAPAERAAFTSPPSRMTSSSPDTQREFDALRKYLGRALSEVVHYARPSGNADGHEEESATAGHSFVAENVPLSSVLVEQRQSLEHESAESSDRDIADLSAKVVAAESLWFASSVLAEVCPKLLHLLPASYAAACDDFSLNFQASATQLRALVYRTMCPALLQAQNVSQTIAESGGWDTKLPAMSSLLPGKSSGSSGTASAGTWVQRLVADCARIWAHMEAFGEKSWGSSAPLVREQVWLELCQAAFDTAMEGFWRVRRVSSEGRRAMIRDVRALDAGLDEVHPCHCPRGLEHVEAILQAALLDSEEMMLWVQDNNAQYTYRHLLGLITQTFGSVMGMNQSRLKDAIGFLDELFDEIEGGDAQGPKEFAHLFGRKTTKDSGGDRSIRNSISEMKSVFKGAVGIKK